MAVFKKYLTIPNLIGLVSGLVFGLVIIGLEPYYNSTEEKMKHSQIPPQELEKLNQLHINYETAADARDKAAKAVETALKEWKDKMDELDMTYGNK